jgi:hypothetical protein
MSLFSWRCIEPKCPNEEAIEPQSSCPQCGSKAQKIGFLDLDSIINSKRREGRLKEHTLITPDMNFEAISEKIEVGMHDLAVLRAKRFPKDSDEIKILTLLSEIHLLQAEQSLRVLLNLEAYFRRLFGP